MSTAWAGRRGRGRWARGPIVAERDRPFLKQVLKHASDVVRTRTILPRASATGWSARFAGGAGAIARRREGADRSPRPQPQPHAHPHLRPRPHQVRSVGDEERAEKALRVAEMEANKASNMITHRDEIYSRPARSWFQSEASAPPRRRAPRTASGGSEAADEAASEAPPARARRAAPAPTRETARRRPREDRPSATSLPACRARRGGCGSATRCSPPRRARRQHAGRPQPEGDRARCQVGSQGRQAGAEAPARQEAPTASAVAAAAIGSVRRRRARRRQRQRRPRSATSERSTPPRPHTFALALTPSPSPSPYPDCIGADLAL